MATVINRTTLEVKTSVNTPAFPTIDWIINPDLSALSGVPKKYWKVVADTVVEMTQPEKDVVDAADAADRLAKNELELKASIFPEPPPLVISQTATGLVIDTVIDDLLTDQYTVVADPTDKTFILLSLIYETLTDTFSVAAFEKTSEGAYGNLSGDDMFVRNIKEWSVVAAGTALVLEEDFT